MGREAKRRAGIISGGVLTLLVLNLVASPAAADTNEGTVGGLTYIGDFTAPITPPAGQGVDAACPPGTHVVGGGADIGGVPFEKHLNTTFPFDGPDADPRPDDFCFAHAWLASGFPDQVEAIAVCKQGKARYRSSLGTVQPGSARTLRAKCPDRTHVSGGGAYNYGVIEDAYVASSYPYDGRDPGTVPDDGWAARVRDVAAPIPTQMSVHAICIGLRPRYVAGAPLTVGSAPLPMTGPACPDSRHIIAAGIRLVAPLAAEARLLTIMPFDLADADSIPDDALRFLAGTTSPSLTATMFRHAICK
jgi:hypothetical protein